MSQPLPRPRSPRPETAGPRPLEVVLNLNVRGLGTSATLAINELSAKLQAEGREIFRLGLGQSPFPVPEPVVAALRRNAHQKDYLPVRGLAALRRAVVEHLARRQGLERSPENVLIGPGSKELLFLTQLSYDGDLLIPTPSWVSYAPQARVVGRRVEWLATERERGWRLHADELERVCAAEPGRPRLLILNYPTNPTGSTYAPDELEALAEAARRHRVLLLSDEIYGELHFEGRHVSIARFYPEGTIVSSGLSKWCGAGGWRLGTYVFPDGLGWLLDAMAAVASETFTSTSAPIQHAAVRAFEGGAEIDVYLERSRRLLRALGRHVAAELERSGAAVAPPEGGFYLFPDWSRARARLERRGVTSGPELCERLLEETGVAMLPGVAFGRPTEELTLRLAFVDFDGEAALDALARRPPDAEPDAAFLAECCPRVTTAVERLCRWMTG